jgi:CRP-like cAMP-binding protein
MHGAYNMDEGAGRIVAITGGWIGAMKLDGALKLHLEAYAKLSQDDRALLGALINKTVREIGSRRDLVREGDKPRAVNVVLEGWGCAYKQLPDGRRQVVSFFIPGDLCDANVFILEEMDHSIGAITAMKYAEIGPEDFEMLMAQSPRITQALWWHELVVASIQREWTTNVGQRTAYERIAHLICELFLRLRAVGRTRGHSCDFPLTQNDLADATGLTAVHVNRVLKELQRQGLINRDKRAVEIADWNRLASVGDFNARYLHFEAGGPTNLASAH